MPCYKPLKGYRSRTVNESGKRGIVFNAKHGYVDMPVNVPCGQCIGCRLEYSRQWALRCLHEAYMYQNNCFITLTYNNENLPEDGSLVKKHFQDFMKRLRKKHQGKEPVWNNETERWEHPIRYYHCGEYGEKNKRPHYHAALFNFDFDDKEIYRIKDGIRLYKSEELEEIWGKGFVTIGEVTFESAAYIARYMLKKHKGENSETAYIKDLDKETGEIPNGPIQLLQPEYSTMSRRPGIGKTFYNKYKGDIYPKDFITVNGKKMQPPRYYDGLYEIENEDEYIRIKNRRKKRAEQSEDNTRERLDVKNAIKERKIKHLIREIEEQNHGK